MRTEEQKRMATQTWSSFGPTGGTKKGFWDLMAPVLEVLRVFAVFFSRTRCLEELAFLREAAGRVCARGISWFLSFIFVSSFGGWASSLSHRLSLATIFAGRGGTPTCAAGSAWAHVAAKVSSWRVLGAGANWYLALPENVTSALIALSCQAFCRRWQGRAELSPSHMAG